jgi:hypothetical protein
VNQERAFRPTRDLSINEKGQSREGTGQPF